MGSEISQCVEDMTGAIGEVDITDQANREGEQALGHKNDGQQIRYQTDEPSLILSPSSPADKPRRRGCSRSFMAEAITRKIGERDWRFEEQRPQGEKLQNSGRLR